MAAAKSTAKKGAAPKRETHRAQLPEGFEAIEGSFAPSWDFDEMPVIQGEVTRLEYVETGVGRDRRTVRVMDIKTPSGERFAVWESAGLRPLFDRAGKGAIVAAAYTGEVEVKGRKQPMHGFQVGIKQEGGEPLPAMDKPANGGKGNSAKAPAGAARKAASGRKKANPSRGRAANGAAARPFPKGADNLSDV